MGYDVSYHAISEAEITQWYFAPLKLARKGEFGAILSLAEQSGVEEFYAQKYKDTLSAALEYGSDADFNQTHGFCVAVAQGFFRKYFYTRGTAFSFLARQNVKFQSYIGDWREILPSEFLENFSGQIHNEITQNYCCGAYINAQNVASLKARYDAGGEIKSMLDEFYAQNLPAFLDALNFAARLKTGLLEATEVIEPNPLDLNSSSSYSNLFNCDPQGAIIYAQTATRQIGEAIERDKANEKKSLFDRFKGLFK